jgi:hypothetical protein
LSENGTAPLGRMQAWLVDGILGSSMALVAITAAQAALPEHPALLSALKPAAVRVAMAPAEAPVLIAFTVPVDGATIDSPFGLRQLPWEGSGRLHAGVDMLAKTGDPVVAAADGVVTEVTQDAGYGRYVEIKHAEGLTTRYAHMARFAKIAVGTAVKAGTEIGYVGSTGSSTGAHLHFEIRDAKDRPMNPELFIGQSFASAADLPLKEALRPAHAGVRVAYVSNIPASKRALMQARLDVASAVVRKVDAAAQARIDAETARRVDASFGEAPPDLSAAIPAPDGRPSMRIRGASSSPSANASGPLPVG